MHLEQINKRMTEINEVDATIDSPEGKKKGEKTSTTTSIAKVAMNSRGDPVLCKNLKAMHGVTYLLA